MTITEESTTRPSFDADPVAKELYDTWLIPNGIDEWLPEGATFTVEGDLCTYTRFSRHNCVGPHDGWNTGGFIIRRDLDPNVSGDEGSTPVVHQRVVKLEVAVTDRVRELFDQSPCTLIERSPSEPDPAA